MTTSTEQWQIARLLAPWMSSAIDWVRECAEVPVPEFYSGYARRPRYAAALKTTDKLFVESLEEIGSALSVVDPRVIPPNWSGVRVEDFRALAVLTAQKGIPVVWTPPADVVRKLLDSASDDGSSLILLSNKLELIADCNDLLQQVHAPAMTFWHDCAKEVIMDFESARYASAQALAASTIMAILHYHVAYPVVVMDPSSAFVGEPPVTQIRSAFIFAGVLRALAPASGADADETFSIYDSSKHASASNCGPAQALIGTLLLTSLLRHLQDLHDRGQPVGWGTEPSDQALRDRDPGK